MCRTWGSNSGPLACQADTLPIELPRPALYGEEAETQFVWPYFKIMTKTTVWGSERNKKKKKWEDTKEWRQHQWAGLEIKNALL